MFLLGSSCTMSWSDPGVTFSLDSGSHAKLWPHIPLTFVLYPGITQAMGYQHLWCIFAFYSLEVFYKFWLISYKRHFSSCICWKFPWIIWFMLCSTKLAGRSQPFCITSLPCQCYRRVLIFQLDQSVCKDVTVAPLTPTVFSLEAFKLQATFTNRI